MSGTVNSKSFVGKDLCALFLCVDIHSIHNIQQIAWFDPLYQLENEEVTVPFTVMYTELRCCTAPATPLSNLK